MIRPGEGIPQTRNQAFSLLKAVHFDVSELSNEQMRAIRELYKLVPLPQGVRYLSHPEGPRE